MPQRPILVGIDGSAAGASALEWAVHEAALRRIGLYVLHVYPWSSRGLLPGSHDDWEDAQRLVDDARHKVGKIDPSVYVRARVVTGDGPAAAIVRRSAEAELIVLGTRGVGGFHELVVGSVALQVAGHAATPVVLVHAGWHPPADDREIAVGVGDDVVLAAAFAEAELRGVRLRAIHAWLPITSAVPADLTPMVSTVADIERHQEAYLARVLASWRTRHPGVEVVGSVVCDRPRRVLAEAAEHAELLVVGASEHPHAVPLGGTAHAVIHQAVCPVLIARGSLPSPGAARPPVVTGASARPSGVTGASQRSPVVTEASA